MLIQQSKKLRRAILKHSVHEKKNEKLLTHHPDGGDSKHL
jgi:hypothetical protein